MTDLIKLTRDPDDAPGGYAKVFAFLREQLLSGALKTGDRLLPERDLSALLGVGRPVLREALRALAMLGAVEIRHGVGTIVRQPDASTLGEFFTFALAQQSDAIDDVMEARIAIECQAVRLACRRATLADFERIRAALQRIEATIDDPVAGGEADFDFHNGIVQAGRSETLRSVYAAISNLVHRSHRGRRELILKVPGIRSFLIDHHHRIFEALVARDVQRSDELLRRHFEIGDEYRRKAFETPRPQG